MAYFKCTGNPQYIENAILHHQNAVNFTPSGHHVLPSLLNNLGNLYVHYFDKTGNLQDIETAILHYQNAVNSTPSGHVNLQSLLQSLGNAYLKQFGHTRNLQDIENSILHHQRAIKCTPSGHANMKIKFTCLGNSFFIKFQHTANQQDIDNAIFYYQNAVKSTSSDFIHFPDILSNLGQSYMYQFQHTGNLQDRENGIFHLQKAVNSAPSGYSSLPTLLSWLGSAYGSQFNHTGNLQDIENSIFYHQKAICSYPSGHASLLDCYNALGNSYFYKFQYTKHLQDIENAIFYHQNAVNSSSGNSTVPLHNLGKSYHDYFKFTKFSPNIQDSINSYRQAAMANGNPSICLESAKNAVALSVIYNQPHCLNDYAMIIDLRSKVAGLEQTIQQHYTNLYGHSTIVVAAVFAALCYSKVDIALEWLENGRCLVWSQLNQLRAPINSLCITNPSLADQFIQAANALEFYGTRSVLYLPPSMEKLSADISLQNDNLNHTLYAAKYKKLLEEIQRLPTFQDFLKPLKSTTLLRGLPKDGPIIIFNIHKVHCDALALISGAEEPLHIPLENFSLADAEKLQQVLLTDILKQRKAKDEERLSSHRKASSTLPQMSFVLSELWTKLVQPIFEALGYVVCYYSTLVILHTSTNYL